MGIFSKDIATLDDLFVHTLQATYYAENQIVKALDTMAGMTTDADLRDGFQQHLHESETQARRLEQVFQMIGREPEETTCPAFDGIKKANDATAADIDDKRVLDAALAGGAQIVEHYEIAQYGKLIAWAKAMGRTDIADLLAQTLAEEKATDDKLTRLAEARLNRAAENAAA